MMAHVFLLGCGVLPASSLVGSHPGAFQIVATVIEALEGGPCVVHVRCSYNGEANLQNCAPESFSVDVPPGWRERQVRETIECVRCPGFATIRKGDSWSQTLFLHTKYTNISSGPSRLRVGLKICQAQPRDEVKLPFEGAYRIIASPTTEIILNVLPATRKNMATFCERMERKLPSDMSNLHLNLQLQCLHETQDSALAALAWRIMERFPSKSLFQKPYAARFG